MVPLRRSARALLDIQIASASLKGTDGGLSVGVDEIIRVQTSYLIAEISVIAAVTVLLMRKAMPPKAPPADAH